CLLNAPFERYRMDKPGSAGGAFRRQPVGRQPVDDFRGDFEGALKLSLGKARVYAHTADRDRNTVCGEGLVLDRSCGLTVYRIGEICAELFQAHTVYAAADFL